MRVIYSGQQHACNSADMCALNPGILAACSMKLLLHHAASCCVEALHSVRSWAVEWERARSSSCYSPCESLTMSALPHVLRPAALKPAAVKSAVQLALHPPPYSIVPDHHQLLVLHYAWCMSLKQVACGQPHLCFHARMFDESQLAPHPESVRHKTKKDENAGCRGKGEMAGRAGSNGLSDARGQGEGGAAPQPCQHCAGACLRLCNGQPTLPAPRV